MLQVLRSEARTPRIGQRPPRLLTQLEQIRMPQRDCFLNLSIVAAQDKLYVDGIAMAQRYRRQQPLELHLPGSSEWVRAGYKFPEVLHVTRKCSTLQY